MNLGAVTELYHMEQLEMTSDPTTPSHLYRINRGRSLLGRQAAPKFRAVTEQGPDIEFSTWALPVCGV